MKKVIAASLVSALLLGSGPALAQEQSQQNQQKQNQTNGQAGKRVEQKAKSQEDVIRGKITAISGTTITIEGARKGTITVNASAANIRLKGKRGQMIQFKDYRVGEEVTVYGDRTGTTMTATKIHKKRTNGTRQQNRTRG